MDTLACSYPAPQVLLMSCFMLTFSFFSFVDSSLDTWVFIGDDASTRALHAFNPPSVSRFTPASFKVTVPGRNIHAAAVTVAGIHVSCHAKPLSSGQGNAPCALSLDRQAHHIPLIRFLNGVAAHGDLVVEGG